VTKINQSLPCENSFTFIGILDISGFEIFLNNSFEQVCLVVEDLERWRI
jgi:myosin heavy subunit